MKEEKDMLIRDYADKKNELEQEITQLVNTIRQLKT